MSYKRIKHQRRSPPVRSKLLTEYLSFIKTHHGLSERTLSIRTNDLSVFLKEFKNNASPSKIARISPSKIHDYIVKKAKTISYSMRKSMSSSLRSFLRFAYMKGYVLKDLSCAVPVIVTRRLASIPRGIAFKDAKKLLKCPDRRTPLGRRNYAILQLLINYGVRINQATHIKLKDIDWESGLIHFPVCKWNKALCLPLKAEVAKAILAYLRHDRGGAAFEEVFLSCIGQPRPLSYNYCLGQSMKAYYDKAGIQSEFRGAHAIRHGFATELMQKRTPIKTIADLLGHRTIRSTFLYTKVDIPQLRLFACQWPTIQFHGGHQT